MGRKDEEREINASPGEPKCRSGSVDIEWLAPCKLLFAPKSMETRMHK